MVSRALLLAAALCAYAGAANPALLTKAWKAHWIAVAGAPPHRYGVYHFRRAFDLAARPDRFVIDVTADNRYQLFVNGTRVSIGPARGDLFHWRYETVDIAPELKPGKNVLAAVVWNDGPFTAIAQISNQTGFLLQADSDSEQVVDSGPLWRCIPDPAYAPHPIPNDQTTGYHALGPNELVDASKYPWGWEQPDFDDSRWLNPAVLSNGEPRASEDAKNRWFLVPRTIPFEERTPEQPLRGASFPIQVPAHTHSTYILDQTYLTTAYPELTVTAAAAPASK